MPLGLPRHTSSSGVQDHPRASHSQGRGASWDARRLAAVAALFLDVPDSCTELALNAGAAEALIGLYEDSGVPLREVLKPEFTLDLASAASRAEARSTAGAGLARRCMHELSTGRSQQLYTSNCNCTNIRS